MYGRELAFPRLVRTSVRENENNIQKRKIPGILRNDTQLLLFFILLKKGVKARACPYSLSHMFNLSAVPEIGLGKDLILI